MSSGVPEHLPGEPVRRGRSDGQILALLPLRALLIAGMWVASLPLWVAFGLSIARWGRPPTTPRSAQVLRYLRWTWTVRPPSPGLGAPQRAWITLTILQHAALTPLWGLAWQVDEALYDLDGVQVRAPVFEISAGRSGSTQLARYLEDDPRLCAPNLLQIMFPYRWLWALSAATIGRWVDRDLIRRRVEALLPPELLDRHEADPFRTDTSDGLLYTSHLHHLAPRLGPEVMVLDLHFAGRAPHNEALWEEDFPDLIDRLARKTLLGRDPRRFFLKGHFLRGASPLARRFPDAVFLAMVREPLPRIRSAINYMRANPVDPVLGPGPLGVVGRGDRAHRGRVRRRGARLVRRYGGPDAGGDPVLHLRRRPGGDHAACVPRLPRAPAAGGGVGPPAASSHRLPAGSVVGAGRPRRRRADRAPGSLSRLAGGGGGGAAAEVGRVSGGRAGIAIAGGRGSTAGRAARRGQARGCAGRGPPAATPRGWRRRPRR